MHNRQQKAEQVSCCFDHHYWLLPSVYVERINIKPRKLRHLRKYEIGVRLWKQSPTDKQSSISAMQYANTGHLQTCNINSKAEKVQIQQLVFAVAPNTDLKLGRFLSVLITYTAILISHWGVFLKIQGRILSNSAEFLF